jgi:hypothetical protein
LLRSLTVGLAGGAYRRAGWTLSTVGRRLGVDWMTYNPVVFEFFHQEAVDNAGGVVAAIRQAFPDAATWADVGAGSGAFAARAQGEGIEVAACEHSSVGRRKARAQGVDSRPFDLTTDPPSDLEPCDLAYSFEVAEHVPPELGERLVRHLSGIAPVVVFTAAHPGQGGIGHINEQPQPYWIELFEQSGMSHDLGASRDLAESFHRHGVRATWFADNVMVFRRNGGGAVTP